MILINTSAELDIAGFAVYCFARVWPCERTFIIFADQFNEGVAWLVLQSVAIIPHLLVAQSNFYFELLQVCERLSFRVKENCVGLGTLKIDGVVLDFVAFGIHFPLFFPSCLWLRFLLRCELLRLDIRLKLGSCLQDWNYRLFSIIINLLLLTIIWGRLFRLLIS
jgi:hypothetical protein